MSIINSSSNTGETALFVASQMSKVGMVETLLKLGADPNQCNVNGSGPLWAACLSGASEVFEILVNNGARLDIMSNESKSVLFPCIQRGHETLATLVGSIAPELITIKCTGGDYPLILCCRTGRSNLLSSFISLINEPVEALKIRANIDGLDCLQAAVEQNRVSCVKVIVSEYPELVHCRMSEDNQILSFGTPLLLAAHYGSLASAEILIESGEAILEDVDYRGRNAAHIAAELGNIDFLRMLKKHGLRLDIEMPDGQTALTLLGPKASEFLDPVFTCISEIAKHENKVTNHIETIIKKAGLAGVLNAVDSLDTRGFTGETPLSIAAKYQNNKMISILINSGCSVDVKNQESMTPRLWIEWSGNRQNISKLPVAPRDSLTGLRLLKESAKKSLSDNFALMLSQNACDTGRVHLVQFDDIFHYESQIVDPLKKGSFSLMTFLSNKAIPTDSLKSIIFDAKEYIIPKIASGSTIGPAELMIIRIYYTCLVKALGMNIFDAYFGAFNSTISKFATNTMYDELYFTRPATFRRPVIGDVVEFSSSFTTSDSWRRIYKEQSGDTMFVIKHGPGVFNMSGNICAVAASKFCVTGVYRCGKFCLGQKNIRDSSYLLNPEDRVSGAIMVMLTLIE
jgi:ankyrin repeat protein